MGNPNERAPWRWGRDVVENGMLHFEGIGQDALVYLATPYSKFPGGPLKGYMAAAELAGRLLSAGMMILSPICHGHPISVHSGLDPLDHTIWLKLDKAIMRRCDVMLIACLPGWQESHGIAVEIEFMAALKKPIYEIDPKTLETIARFG